MKLRYLFGIILELAIAAVTLLIGKVLLVAGFDALPAAVLAWMRAQTGFLDGAIEFVLELYAYVLYLAIWWLLRKAVYSLIYNEQASDPPSGEAPPDRRAAFDPNAAQIEPASVVMKRKRTVRRKKGGPAETQYFVIFGLGRYQRMEFPISQELYQTLSNGDRGTLAYRQEREKKTFLWFRKDGEEVGF